MQRKASYRIIYIPSVPCVLRIVLLGRKVNVWLPYLHHYTVISPVSSPSLLSFPFSSSFLSFFLVLLLVTYDIERSANLYCPNIVKIFTKSSLILLFNQHTTRTINK